MAIVIVRVLANATCAQGNCVYYRHVLMAPRRLALAQPRKARLVMTDDRHPSHHQTGAKWVKKTTIPMKIRR